MKHHHPPIHAYAAYELAQTARAEREERERQNDEATLAYVYDLIREAASKGELNVIWPTDRGANTERRVEYVKKALKANGYRLLTAAGGWRITWSEAPPQAAPPPEATR